jgi:hypothetical protein
MTQILIFTGGGSQLDFNDFTNAVEDWLQVDDSGRLAQLKLVSSKLSPKVCSWWQGLE